MDAGAGSKEASFLFSRSGTLKFQFGMGAGATAGFQIYDYATSSYAMYVQGGKTIFGSGGTAPTYTLESASDVGIGTVGKTYREHFGSSGDMFNDVTLSSGVATITISGLTSSDRAFCQLISESGTLGAAVTAVCTTNTLTITSVVAAGTTNTLDNSTYTYHIKRPY